MENFEEKKQFPTGTGEQFLEKRKELRLPAVEVKNTVIWVNPAFREAPFKLKQGTQSPLGIFFTPRPEAYSDEEIRNSFVMPEDDIGRSGLLGEVVFRDREGR